MSELVLAVVCEDRFSDFCQNRLEFQGVAAREKEEDRLRGLARTRQKRRKEENKRK